MIIIMMMNEALLPDGCALARWMETMEAPAGPSENS